VTHLAEARAEVLEELHQVLHGLDHLGHRQVVEHLFALADDLAHFRLVEAQKQRRGALQDASGAFDQLFTSWACNQIIILELEIKSNNLSFLAKINTQKSKPSAPLSEK
jgi:hypothetical protein